MNKIILTGSNAFFKSLDGFKPKDSDTIIIVEKPKGFKVVRQMSSGKHCTFEIADLPKDNLISFSLEHGTPMEICRYLTPKYAEHIGLTISDLDRLQPLVDKLDKKHLYLAEIFLAYKKNNSFLLTDKQREKAFNVYLEARKKK